MNSLTVVAPGWLRAHSPADWVERYRARIQNYRLPARQAQREAYAEVIGADGRALWQALEDPAALVWLRQIPAVLTCDGHATSAGMNLMRVARWLAEEPLGQARPSAFVRLHQMTAA